MEAAMLADALRDLIARYEYDGIPNDSLPVVEAARKALAEHDESKPSRWGPTELWLQLHGDCSDVELDEPVDHTSDDVTWCWHPIYPSDVRYVRADLANGVQGSWKPAMLKHPDCAQECQQAVDYGVQGEHCCSPVCVRLKHHAGVPPSPADQPKEPK
jgi:hypothetical protein